MNESRSTAGLPGGLERHSKEAMASAGTAWGGDPGHPLVQKGR